jgi:carboxyl-terminal processing protease
VDFTDDENTLQFNLALPSIPQGTSLDLDNDGEEDNGVQVFAVAYWSNTWGGPFLEPRDGRGWSTAYASTITDPNQDDEIIGGFLIIWSPDDEQGFPTGFGSDDELFTADDPVASVPGGYSIVDLNQEPFEIYKEPQPFFELVEGASAVKDFSDMDRGEAFEAMFTRVAREYPFTEEKEIDWEALESEFFPRAAAADNPDDYYRVVRDFTFAIPDAHVGVSFNAQVFFEDAGGSFGLVLAQLTDGRIIVTEVIPGTLGAQEGIQVGAQIISWDKRSAQQALAETLSYFGPYSTSHHEAQDKLIFLTRVPPDTRVEIEYQNPEESPKEVTLQAAVEYDSLFEALPGFTDDELMLPLEAEVLDASGLGYIKINTFSDDYNLMARLWDGHIEALLENEVPGLILDLRVNGGGSGGLAMDFAGYFFSEEIILHERSYFNELTGQFEAREIPTRVEPGPILYEGPIAILVSPTCISACEGFTYALTQRENTIVVGHFPTAGAFGEVGRGQYELPDELSLQFPTGRPETLDGQLVIEGLGVTPDIFVEITEDSALGLEDAVLTAAVEALLEEINN